MHDNRCVCISTACCIKGMLILENVYFWPTFCLPPLLLFKGSTLSFYYLSVKVDLHFLLQGGRYQGIFSLSQVHFIFSPCLPRIFKGHDDDDQTWVNSFSK